MTKYVSSVMNSKVNNNYHNRIPLPQHDWGKQLQVHRKLKWYCLFQLQACHAPWIRSDSYPIGNKGLRHFCDVVHHRDVSKRVEIWHVENSLQQVTTEPSLCVNFYLNTILDKLHSLTNHLIWLPVNVFCPINLRRINWKLDEAEAIKYSHGAIADK